MLLHLMQIELFNFCINIILQSLISTYFWDFFKSSPQTYFVNTLKQPQFYFYSLFLFPLPIVLKWNLSFSIFNIFKEFKEKLSSL